MIKVYKESNVNKIFLYVIVQTAELHKKLQKVKDSKIIEICERVSEIKVIQGHQ